MQVEAKYALRHFFIGRLAQSGGHSRLDVQAADKQACRVSVASGTAPLARRAVQVNVSCLSHKTDRETPQCASDP